MLDIHIKTIPHKDQRYETCGDWQWDGDKLTITISAMESWEHEVLVAIHEAVEAILCNQVGIKQEVVDQFDKSFETLREQEKELIGDQEPGMMVSAPYHKQHAVATSFERVLAAELGVNWNLYENEINNL